MVNFHQTTRRHNQADISLYRQCYVDLKYQSKAKMPQVSLPKCMRWLLVHIFQNFSNKTNCEKAITETDCTVFL